MTAPARSISGGDLCLLVENLKIVSYLNNAKSVLLLRALVGHLIISLELFFLILNNIGPLL